MSAQASCTGGSCLLNHLYDLMEISALPDMRPAVHMVMVSPYSAVLVLSLSYSLAQLSMPIYSWLQVTVDFLLSQCLQRSCSPT